MDAVAPEITVKVQHLSSTKQGDQYGARVEGLPQGEKLIAYTAPLGTRPEVVRTEVEKYTRWACHITNTPVVVKFTDFLS